METPASPFGLIELLVLVAALGSALMAGLFFVFSVAVMKALGDLPAAQGIAAMQSINRVIVNRSFLSVFFGAAAGCVVLLAWALLRLNEPGASLVLAGSFCYLIGTLGVTMLFNVPRNNALARVDPHGKTGARLWADYLVGWTNWNHVRTAASLVALVCFIVALVRSAGG